MNDSFGTNIQTGFVVEISGSCIKSHNGLWVVESAYSDSVYCHKLTKTMHKVKDSAVSSVSWPLRCYSNNAAKRREVNRYNAENACITVLCPWVEPKKKPVDDNKIKILKRGIKKGDSYCSCFYSLNSNGNIHIYARHYNEHIPRELGNVKNDSDSMYDYFETDSLILTPDSPYYQDALKCCKNN